MKKVSKILIEKYKEKRCTKCQGLRPVVDFHETTSNKSGLASHCKFCYNAHKRIKYAENPEKHKEKKKKFYANNTEYTKNYNTINWKSIQSANKTYRIEKAELIKIQKKSAYEQNKIHIKAKVIEYERKKYQTDSLFKLKKVIRKSIGQSIRKGGFTKKSRTHEILGCTYEEFKVHIESQFESWMNWDNHGLYNGEYNFGWDLDHIEPIASALTEGDIIERNNYTNFQPLCSKINRNEKRDKVDFKY